MKTINRYFTRRDIIKGLGVTGLLSSLSVERLLAQTTIAPVRTLFIPIQHGWGISAGSNRDVTGSTDNFTFPDGLDPLNSIRNRICVVDGLGCLGEWGNNHDLRYGDILTAGVPHGESGSAFDGHMPLSVNASIDYLLQEASGKDTFRFSARYRSWGVRYHPLSFDHNSTVLPYFTTAFDAYNSIFRDLPDTSDTPTNNTDQREARLLANVAAFIKSPATAQLDQISSSEAEKLERYLLAVENLESKKAVSVGYSGSERLQSIPSSSQDSLADLDDYLQMVKVGFANNITTSAVVGIGDINDIADFHHSHAHSNSSTFWDTRRGFAQSVVNIVNEMENIVDFDGRSLMDNTIIVLTGEVGDGEHNLSGLGHIVIGGGGGAIQTGRWIQPRTVHRDLLTREDINGALQQQWRWTRDVTEVTNADLFREIANISGININEFGLPSQNRGSVLL